MAQHSVNISFRYFSDASEQGVKYWPLTRMPVKRVRVMFQLKQALCTGSPWFDLIGHLVTATHQENLFTNTTKNYFWDDKGSVPNFSSGLIFVKKNQGGICADFWQNLSKIRAKIWAKSQKSVCYPGDFPQMPRYPGPPGLIRATWAHCKGSMIEMGENIPVSNHWLINQHGGNRHHLI